MQANSNSPISAGDRSAPAGWRPGRRTRVVAAITALSAGGLTLSSCGLGTSAGLSPSGKLAGPLANVKSLDGAHLAVGSKQFTEQVILGKIAVILLKSAGADVSDFTTIPGSSAAREAQLQGQVQMMFDYTGTGWISYLGKTDPLKTSQAQYEAVAKADAKNGLTWLPPAPENNTYDFAARADVAKKFGVSSLSDLKKVPVKDRTLCVDAEFASRNDGLQPMLKAYGIPLGSGVPKSNLRTMDSGSIYAAINSHVCNFGEVFTTDGRIERLHLTTLKDDKQFFPLYNLSMVVRTETLNKYPQLRELFTTVSKKITNEVMIKLNAKVDVDGKDYAEVAQDWLKSEGFIK